MNFAAVR